MMIKPVICDRVSEKRRKWAIFEELNERNEALDEAITILDDLKILLMQLPEKLSKSAEQAEALSDSVVLLDSSLDKCIESTSVHFGEIEIKLDELQRSLLHDDTCNMVSFSKLVSEVRCSQKLVDTLIGNAEEEIYRFLESECLYGERKNTDIRIMEFVMNS